MGVRLTHQALWTSGVLHPRPPDPLASRCWGMTTALLTLLEATIPWRRSQERGLLYKGNLRDQESPAQTHSSALPEA